MFKYRVVRRVVKDKNGKEIEQSIFTDFDLPENIWGY
jgi:hypothetical protein